ncbi:MAG: alpha/beta hydrolase [Pseudomonadota bacterium]
MTDMDLEYTERDGRRLAVRHRAGDGPTILFLPGYMSDMQGGKATALDGWAADAGRAMLRFDYGGCGESAGAFADQTLDDWLADTVHMIDRATDGPVILVGSSMGGWLMLLAALARPDRIAGLTGIAAAPDFTGWGFDDGERRRLARGETLSEPSAYSDEPYITTAAFWRSGEANRLLGGDIAIDAPVRLLHGQADIDVPFRISVELAARLRSADVHVHLIKDGDHRLSRPADIDLLIGTVADLVETPPS